MNENNISINELYFNPVFTNFNMLIQKNKINIIAGPNNCGKTTLIKILNREYPYIGKIFIDNQNLMEYEIDEYFKKVKTVYPENISFICETIEEEVTYYVQSINNNDCKELIKKLKLTKYKKSILNDMEEKIKIKVKLLLYLLSNPKIIMIDSLSLYFSKKEIKEILEAIKWYQNNHEITFIITTNNLEISLEADYLYIIAENNVILEGNPMEVLQKDNIINKIGLNVPFMIDLSVKLRDYDLVDEIELDMNRMVDKLWK